MTAPPPSEVLNIGFGPLVHAGNLRDAIQGTVSYWSLTYLAEMARLENQPADSFPDFRSYPDSVDPAGKYPEEQLPSCIIIVPGITKPPEKRGRGVLRARFAAGLGIVVQGPQKARTVRLAEIYTTAVRTIMLQKGGLSGSGDVAFAHGISWQGESYTEPTVRDQARTLVAGMLRFEIDVDEVVDIYQGPVTPIIDGATPTGWPTVATPDVTVNAYPTDEEIPTP